MKGKRSGYASVCCAIGLAAWAAPPACQLPENSDWRETDPVTSQLRWLARNQQADGSWGNPKSPPAVRTRLTGMALISLMATGYTHFSKDEFDGIQFGPAIKRGLEHLTTRQDDDGCLVRGDDYLMEHLWGALALTEYHGSIGSPVYQESAAKAVAYLGSRQRPDGSWGTGDSPHPMTTLLALLVIESARDGGLKIPDAMVQGANNALAALAERDARSSFDPVTTAALLAVASIWKSDRDAWYPPFARTWAERTARALESASASDLWLTHWGSVALSHYDGANYHGISGNRPVDKRWDAWSGKLKDLMTNSQRMQARYALWGSLDPPKEDGKETADSGSDNARIEATCLNGLNLILFWRSNSQISFTKENLILRTPRRHVWIEHMD
jgi:hypothetical protein